MTNNLAGDVAKKVNRHMPTILTVLSGVGLAATSYLFTRAGMKAQEALMNSQAVRVEDGQVVFEDLVTDIEDKISLTWHYYLIPASVATATLVCMVSANVLNTQRQATLMGAYALGERTWAKYRGKVAEMVGVDNEQTIRTETVKDVASETKVPSEVYGDGDVIYYDVFSGQMFRSDEKTILKAQENTNALAEEDGFVTLNYFYDQIGARTSEIGEHMGWMDGHYLDVTLTPVTFENGTEGYGIDYQKYPSWGYPEV